VSNTIDVYTQQYEHPKEHVPSAPGYMIDTPLKNGASEESGSDQSNGAALKCFRAAK
jgi:hypothetical protein